jgi:tetratricopeptide (TPR) repeat protein
VTKARFRNPSAKVSKDPPENLFQPIYFFFKEGRLQHALFEANKLLETFPKSVLLHTISATCNDGLKNFDAAIYNYKKILKIKPHDATIHHNMGVALQAKGDLKAAIFSYKKALKTNTGYTLAYVNMGVALQKQGNLKLAILSFKRALQIAPDNAEVHYSMGNAQSEHGDLDAANVSYKKALKIQPNFPAVYLNMGLTLQNQGDPEAALVSYKKAIEIDPKNAVTYFNMGLTLQGQGDLEAALSSYKKAIEIDPDYAAAHYNMGNVQREHGDLEVANVCYKKALKAKPNFPEAYLNMGVGLGRQGDLEAALASYKKAIEIDPEYADAYVNMGMAQLGMKDFKNGTLNYEWRKASNQLPFNPLVSGRPEWNAFKKSGRVLLWAEQGVGDEVMFASTIPQLYAKSDKLIIQIDDRLIPLFKRSFPEDIIYYSNKDKVPESEYDFHIPMGSTLKYFRTNLDSFKQAENGYLKSDAARSAKLRKKLAINDCDYLVGISWRGGSEVNRLTKSMQLSQIVNALPNKKVKIINLQYGDTDHECQELETVNGIIIHNVSEVDNFNDIDGLASLIDACDQVVSISTTAVHLAGALGKKTTVLLPFSCDWRWGRNGSDSYWYSSVRLLRQEKISDWSDPLAKLHLEFE